MSLVRNLAQPLVGALARGMTEVRGGGLSLANYGPSNPLYIAHRGSAAMYPENTIEAFRASVAAGQRIIEPDVRLLTDGGLGVMHDSTTERTTTSALNVVDLDTAAFKALQIDANDWHRSNFGNALSPPLFTEILAEFGNTCLIVPEIKSTGTAAPLVAALQAANIHPSRALVQTGTVSWLNEPISAGYPALFITSTDTDISAVQATGTQWVGINKDAGQTIFANWIAAGFKAVAWTTERRWERDMLLGWGVSGIFSDDAQYLSRSTPLSTTDNYATQTWSPGMLASDESMLYRGYFYAPDYWGYSGDTTNSYQGCLQGWACPIKGNPDADDFTIAFKVTFESANAGDGTRWASVFIANNDRKFADTLLPFSADLIGYHVLMRKNGQLAIYKRTATGNTQISGTTLATIADGTEVSFRLIVTPTTIRIERLDGSGNIVGGTTATDSTPGTRGGYFHFGRTGLACKFRDVSIS